MIRALKDYFVATVLERTLHWGGICFKWGVSIASSCKYVYKTLCFICKCTCRWPPQTWRMMSRISTRNRPLRKNMIDLNWSMFIQLCRDAASKIALPRFRHHQSLIFPAHFRCRIFAVFMILRFFEVFLLVLAAAGRAQRWCDEGFDWPTRLPTDDAGKHWWRDDSGSLWATIEPAWWMSENV